MDKLSGIVIYLLLAFLVDGLIMASFFIDVGINERTGAWFLIRHDNKRKSRMAFIVATLLFLAVSIYTIIRAMFFVPTSGYADWQYCPPICQGNEYWGLIFVSAISWIVAFSLASVAHNENQIRN